MPGRMCDATYKGVRTFQYVCKECKYGFLARIDLSRPGKHIVLSFHGMDKAWVRALLIEAHFHVRKVRGGWVAD